MAISAARWQTMSAPVMRAMTESRSRTSPGTTSMEARTVGSRDSSHPHEPNELYCTIARTRYPDATSVSVRWEPMNPSAPVMATVVVILSDRFLSGADQ